jgi:adenosylcobinamide kinase/adenosylcobinamide-phosphate guanylyltransferase
MDRRGAWTGGSVRDDVDRLVDAVGAFSAPLVVVSPEVGLSVVPATESGQLFADALGELNQRLAAVCDQVVLVIAGQALIVKESQ